MDQVTNPLNNDVRLEMDIPNHQVVAYQDKSYCQIWCMTIRQRSCQIDLPPVFHPETARCPRPASVGQTP